MAHLPIVYSEHHRRHDTAGVLVEGRPLGSFELPERVEIILAALQAAGLGPVLSPRDHGLAPILALHDPEYVQFLRTVYDEQAAFYGEPGPVVTWTFAGRHAARKPHTFHGLKGYYAFGWGTPILEGTWEAAYWSAQCALTAAHLVREGEPLAYALCRPPGHHAAADLYGGYCYLNNAGLAAHNLLPAGRVAILDVDYHHGNGTQLLFYEHPDVLYCSLHAHPDEDYPYYWGDADERGAGPGLGTNHNVPLPRGIGDEDYLAALDGALDAVRGWAPRHLVLSVGFDGLEGDPEGGFCLTRDGLVEVARRITALALPTVIVQEGGYQPDRLGANAVAFLLALLQPGGSEGESWP
jgi:acetoin utilization deacetylase AcuC-like enzyme